MYGVNRDGNGAYRRDAEARNPVCPVTHSVSRGGEKAIAIVDDDGLVRASMGNLIRALGYSVELFTSGISFLSEDVGRFSCVVSDMQMPEMSGLALQEKITALAPTLPVLFLTAFPDEWARSRALAGGARAFFEKPCDLDEFVAVLEAVVGRPSPRS